MTTLYRNWCSTVDSPTYKFSLYIVGDTGWDDFTNVGKPGHQSTLIAESGSTAMASVENVLMQSTLIPAENNGNSMTQAMQFDIYEIGGFSLIHRILEAARGYGYRTLQSSQYVMKLEFGGRNSETGAYVKYGHATFFRLILQDINAQATPGGTTYNIIASNVAKAALQNSSISSSVTLRNITTVDSLLGTLERELNAYEQERRKKSENEKVSKHTRWKIIYKNKVEINGQTVPEKHTIKSLLDKKIDLSNREDRSGTSIDPDNPDAAMITVSAGTNIVSFIPDTIAKHVNEYATEIDADNIVEGKNMIVVVPSIKVTTEVDDHLLRNVEEITLTIIRRINFTTPPKNKTLLEDTTTMNDRIKNMAIRKLYEPMISSINTEVLDYNVTYNSLFRTLMDPVGYLATTGEEGGAQTVRAGSPHETNVDRPKYNYNKESIWSDTIYDLVPESAAEQTNIQDMKAMRTVSEHRLMAAMTDQMEIDIQIKGDPYYLASEMTAQTEYNGGEAVSTSDVSTILPLDREVMIAIINYLPIDLTTINPSRELDIVGSAIMRVLTVESKFQKGEFTQTLKGYRDRNTTMSLLTDTIAGWRWK